jgi:hypothetical protein
MESISMHEGELHQRMFDRTRNPSEATMISFIADSKAIRVWKQLQKYLDANYELSIETIYYGNKYGWLVRYRMRGRTIVSLFPEKHSFSVLIVYGKKEIEKFSTQKSEFLPAIVDIFANTKKLHDGKWLWIRVADSSYLEDLKKLIAIKRRPKKLEKFRD